MKSGLLQLSSHEHSGKLRPHAHTSYAGLVFMLLLSGVLLLSMSWAAQAAVPAVNPQAGSVGLTGTVRGPAPQTSASILSPASGSRTAAIPVTVSGACPTGTFVTITKNGVFGGVTQCEDDGTFTLLVDLFVGANVLIAKVTDALGQAGPDSRAVNVIYDAPVDANAPNPGQQIFLEVTTSVTAADPGQDVTRTATIVGGTGPYAASWDWGDGQTSLSSHAIDGPISASHTYTRAGTYRVTLKVTDTKGNGAYIQMITVVNGVTTPLGSTSGNGSGALSGALVAAWPLFLLAVLMVFFFWLGERREAHKLKKQMRSLGI